MSNASGRAEFHCGGCDGVFKLAERREADGMELCVGCSKGFFKAREKRDREKKQLPPTNRIEVSITDLFGSEPEDRKALQRMVELARSLYKERTGVNFHRIDSDTKIILVGEKA